MLIEKISLASREDELDYFFRGAHDRDPLSDRGDTLPFGVFAKRGIENIDLAGITVFCGGSTSPMLLLENVLYSLISGDYSNRSRCFEDYAHICYVKIADDVDSKHISVVRITADNILSFINEQATSYNASFGGLLEFYESQFVERSVCFISMPENYFSLEEIQQFCNLVNDFSKYSGVQFIIFSNSINVLGIKNCIIYDLDKTPFKPATWHNSFAVDEYRKNFDELLKLHKK